MMGIPGIIWPIKLVNYLAYLLTVATRLVFVNPYYAWQLVLFYYLQ